MQAAPVTGGLITLRLRDVAAGATDPGTIWLESSLRGATGPITVANG